MNKNNLSKESLILRFKEGVSPVVLFRMQNYYQKFTEFVAWLNREAEYDRAA